MSRRRCARRAPRALNQRIVSLPRPAQRGDRTRSIGRHPMGRAGGRRRIPAASLAVGLPFWAAGPDKPGVVAPRGRRRQSLEGAALAAGPGRSSRSTSSIARRSTRFGCRHQGLAASDRRGTRETTPIRGNVSSSCRHDPMRGGRLSDYSRGTRQASVHLSHDRPLDDVSKDIEPCRL